MAAGFFLTNGNIIVPLAGACVVAALFFAWQFPKTVYYTTFCAACTIETYQLYFVDSTTDRIPFFWDVNTIIQEYGHHDFHALPFNPFELLLFLAGLTWFVRGIYNKSLNIKCGTLLLPIIAYICCVIGGLVHGLSSGGNQVLALFEIRAQFYLLFAYMMSVNSAGDTAKQVHFILWATAVCIGIKGLLATIRFIVFFHGSTIPEIGIGAHEESFFFDVFVIELAVLKLADMEPKLRRTMLFMLPLVLIANLANQRRAATAAMVIALVPLLVLCYVSFKSKRRLILVSALSIAVISAVYFPIFWNQTGELAQPARALKSQFSPDARDMSSNLYRDEENSNLLYTLKTSPVIGYGYGKPYILHTAMVDLTSIDPMILILAHNQILWVWMRLGFIGFFLFWIMMCSFLTRGCVLARSKDADPEARLVAVLTVLFIVMQLVFGLLDLQLSNVRNMLFCGFWIGTMGALDAALRDRRALREQPWLSNTSPRWQTTVRENSTS